MDKLTTITFKPRMIYCVCSVSLYLGTSLTLFFPLFFKSLHIIRVLETLPNRIAPFNLTHCKFLELFI